MAKLIILEGLSRTGKTSIAKNLCDNGLGRIISIKDKMPEGCDLTSFYKGTFYSYDAFFRAFPEETFILDRSFLSELVYSKFFGRNQAFNAMYLVDFFKSHEIKLFYLWNEHLDYMKRGPKDRIIYDAKDYARLKNLFGKAINLVEELNYKPESISCINTSEFNLEQTTNFIKQNLWNKNTKNP
jgi:thymidylate kinase